VKRLCQLIIYKKGGLGADSKEFPRWVPHMLEKMNYSLITEKR
jgi:nitrate reductase assembly molybdenum cofactor insertion protein NarJ